jgi:CheY-like chemotaxis protein
VKQSGGHIKIYSELDSGTSVKIYLPRNSSEAKVERVPPRVDVSVLTSGESILIVEDDEDVRNFTRTALISLGYRVYEASDAVSGLEVLAEHPQIALLLSDVGLPGMNGRRLAEEAHARRPEIKVLYTTGYARNAIVHHGLVDPGVNLLPKPYTTQALGRKVRQVLEIIGRPVWLEEPPLRAIPFRGSCRDDQFFVRSPENGWTKTMKVNQLADQIGYVVARIVLTLTVTYLGMLIKTLCVRFGCGCRRLSCPP